jgi:hypothetical protein
MGSGVRIRNSVMKYGIDNHIKEILTEVESRKEASKIEKDLISQARHRNENLLNIADGGFDEIGRLSPEELSSITKITWKRRNDRRKTDDAFDKWCQSWLSANKGKIRVNNGSHDIMVFPDSIPAGFYKGSVYSNPVSGKIHITNGQVGRVIDQSEEISDGWRRGRLKDKSGKKVYISNGHVVLKIPENSPIPEEFHRGNSLFEGRLRYINIETKKSRYLLPSDNIPDGFVKYSENPFKMVIITDGKKNSRIWEGEPIPQGWILGGKKTINGKKRENAKKERRRFWITNGTENHTIPKGAAIPAEFYQGKVEKVKILPKKKWITDSIVNKQVPLEDALPVGWSIGMTKEIVYA